MARGGGRVGLEMVWTPEPAMVATGYFLSAEKLEDMRRPVQEITELFASELSLNFALEGRPVAWPDLAPSTKAKKLSKAIRGQTFEEGGQTFEITKTFIKEGTEEFQQQIMSQFGGKILQDTGRLEDAASDPNSWAISVQGRETVARLVGTPGYGTPHITGGPNLPQRDWTFISEEAIDEAEEILTDWVMEPFGG